MLRVWPHNTMGCLWSGCIPVFCGVAHLTAAALLTQPSCVALLLPRFTSAFMFVMDDEKDVNMTECVFDARAEDSNMFNAAEPNGRHVLNLASPYERTVVTEILQVGACHCVCAVARTLHECAQ